MVNEIILKVENLVKTYRSGKIETKAVQGLTFEVKKGEIIALSGPSGSGKSTTLYQIGLLDTPTSGKIFLLGEDTSLIKNGAKSEVRLKEIGYVFQHYELLPELTALENVFVPLIAIGKKEYKKEAEKALQIVGLEDRRHHYPFELSGGEQQRVSIARAIVNSPQIILADEPTANLDSVAGKNVMELLRNLSKKMGKTVIIVNHEKAFEKYFDRIIRIEDGKLLKVDKKK